MENMAGEYRQDQSIWDICWRAQCILGQWKVEHSKENGGSEHV